MNHDLATQIIEQARIDDRNTDAGRFFNGCLHDLVHKVLEDHPHIDCVCKLLNVANESRVFEEAYDTLFEDFAPFADPMLREAVCSGLKFKLHDLIVETPEQEEVLLWMD